MPRARNTTNVIPIARMLHDRHLPQLFHEIRNREEAMRQECRVNDKQYQRCEHAHALPCPRDGRCAQRDARS